jgi:hypothetical protein
MSYIYSFLWWYACLFIHACQMSTILGRPVWYKKSKPEERDIYINRCLWQGWNMPVLSCIYKRTIRNRFIKQRPMMIAHPYHRPVLNIWYMISFVCFREEVAKEGVYRSMSRNEMHHQLRPLTFCLLLILFPACVHVYDCGSFCSFSNWIVFSLFVSLLIFGSWTGLG